ncbi:hypothetical protein [Acidovorax sp. BLS4]|uniref:hypothetical protein n=1 Tax=Acidovorax sp. BLS4 TaxID=3273430 RepID=UPI00294381C3|nr:hypothetical protein [Paracidovorax avenae]WOI46969.1 hypothetical protein R1Z03_07090 [Paracidovorax avenae]
MTIVLASAAYWAPARYTLVGDDAKPCHVDFRVRFKRLKRSERQALEDQLTKKEIDDKVFLDRVLTDWELKDVRGQAVPYTEATRADLVEDWDGFEVALVQAFFDAGRKSREAAEIEKNSAAPSATTA